MNMLKQLNAAIEYIEASLCTELDLDTAAGIACVTADSFVRFFSYMTGMTLTEYIGADGLRLRHRTCDAAKRRLSTLRLNTATIVRRLFQELLRNSMELHHRSFEKTAVLSIGIAQCCIKSSHQCLPSPLFM